MLSLNIMYCNITKHNFTITNFHIKGKKNMKKNKLITLSILGLLLLVPFMVPAKAVPPPSYVGVLEEEQISWIMYIHTSQYGQWDIDNMSAAFTSIFGIDDFGVARVDWGISSTPPQAYWPLTVTEILPEVTDDFLSAYFIYDNITYTPLSTTYGYSYWTGGSIGPSTQIIVNDTVNFARQNLFGGMAMSPYWIMGVQLGPKNIDWSTFSGWANWGMANYWGGLAGNNTVTALSNGYSMSVPVNGFALQNQFNNSLPITINATYNTDGILQSYTLEYGTALLYGYYYYAGESYIDAVDPVIISSPTDFSIPVGYTGQQISWIATDANPGNYTIERDGTTTVVSATPWTNGTQVTYNITDGLGVGDHTFEITFEDFYGNTISDTLTMQVYIPDTTDPVLTSTPSDITHTLSVGDLGEAISWTATDLHAATYIIKMNGTTEVLATPWVSGTPVIYYAYYVEGVTTYEITFSDDNGNSVSDSVTMTVHPIPPATTPPPGIPGFEPLIVLGIFTIGTIGLIVFKKKRK